MYEYKVLTVGVREAEKVLNQLAREGWRLVQQSPNMAMGMGLVVTLERKIGE